jgi:hypothetical protein
MTEEDIKLLERNGWTVDCESPKEISHFEGSAASGMAVEFVIAGLREEEKQAEEQINFQRRLFYRWRQAHSI